MTDVDNVPGWSRLKILGKGAFGCISLWKEESTQKLVAIKTLVRPMEDLREKQKEYWKKEVDIMYKIKHENVVAAVPLPQNLITALKCSLPPLGLEYCTGGDLRRLLGRSENLRGLPERDVRHILHDLSEALKYLHGMRIIHRDLKPDNIVIQPNVIGRNVYKVIDLGYAKQLEQSSLAQSFVGTLVYLAPELFRKNQYNFTVDYWSFGVLAFEVATGIRPFFHDQSPLEWIQMIEHKKNVIIYAHKTPNGNEFSSKLPEWCSANSVFKEDFTNWLRTMLAFKPEDRKSEPESSLDIMLAILNRRVFHVYDSFHQQTQSFSEDHKPEELYMRTMIPENSQLIINANGELTQYKNLLDEGVAHVEDGAICAYLFHTSEKYCLSTRELPLKVKALLRKYQGKVSYPEQRELWMELCFYVRSEFEICKRTLASYRTLLLFLNTCYSEFNAKINSLSSSYKEMKVLAQTLREIGEYDKQQLRKMRHSALDELSSGEKLDASVQAVQAIKDRMRTVIALSSSLHKKLLALRENPFGRTQPPAVLETLHDSVTGLFHALRQKTREERAGLHANTEMIVATTQFREEHERVLKDVSDHITDAIAFVKELKEALNMAVVLLTDVDRGLTKLKLQHRSHYTSLWNIIKKLMVTSTDTSELDRAALHDSINNVPTVDRLVKENDNYRSQLDSLNTLMEQECATMLSVTNPQFASFL